MHSSTAKVPTMHASRYLQQLCKHFGHKIPVEFNESQGRIEFPFGLCHLQADEQTLTLIVEGGAKDIVRLENVVGDHLTRFAFREPPAISWQSNH